MEVQGFVHSPGSSHPPPSHALVPQPALWDNSAGLRSINQQISCPKHILSQSRIRFLCHMLAVSCCVLCAAQSPASSQAPAPLLPRSSGHPASTAGRPHLKVHLGSQQLLVELGVLQHVVAMADTLGLQEIHRLESTGEQLQPPSRGPAPCPPPEHRNPSELPRGFPTPVPRAPRTSLIMAGGPASPAWTVR